MQNTIVKAFTGQYIDLSKVVSISDARFLDRMGSGGWFVTFEINVQLMEKPIVYTRKFEYDEYNFNDKHELIYAKDRRTPLAVERLQKQVDDLVRQWKEIFN